MPAGKPSRHPTRLSASVDWTEYETPRPQGTGLMVLDIVAVRGRPSVWVVGVGRRASQVRRTDDGGLTWQVERAR